MQKVVCSFAHHVMKAVILNLIIEAAIMDHYSLHLVVIALGALGIDVPMAAI